MKPKMTTYTLSTLPPLTEAQQANLKALAARPESEIDYSDIPEFTEEQWKNARRGVFYLEGESFEPYGETVTNTMSESAFQKIKRGLERGQGVHAR
jgi:hypothetical protein